MNRTQKEREKISFNKGLICHIDGCNTGIFHHMTKTCGKHYRRFKANGSYELKPKQLNTIIIKDNHAEIILYNNLKCLISKSDIDFVKNKKWSYSESNGVITQTWNNGKNSHKKLHRLLMGEPKNKVIDHINGDRLDNRRENLRILEHWQNIINHNGSWCVRFQKNNQRIYIGLYNNLAEAKKVRDKYAKEIHGDLRQR